jgi:hypothetical protein
VDATIIISFLLGLIVFQQLYWAKQCQRLIDKLMSRDYGFYKAQDKTPEKVVRMQLPEEQDLDFGSLSEVGRI